LNAKPTITSARPVNSSGSPNRLLLEMALAMPEKSVEPVAPYTSARP